MEYPRTLQRGRLIRRYKRFLADVELDGGETVTVHCPNPGSMMGLAEPGMEVWLSRSDNPKRKLACTLELVDMGTSLVGINTSLANAIAEEAIISRRIPELSGYSGIRREVRYGMNSRIDLLLEDRDRPPCYVEVKNVTLKRDSAMPGVAEFPDAVTKRGAKHLVELAAMVAGGARAVMLYVAPRSDCDRFTVAADIDPDYARTLREAMASGVEVLSYCCQVSSRGIEVTDPLKIEV